MGHFRWNIPLMVLMVTYFNLGLYGKMNKRLFSETMVTLLNLNCIYDDNWMVPYCLSNLHLYFDRQDSHVTTARKKMFIKSIFCKRHGILKRSSDDLLENEKLFVLIVNPI